MSSKELTDEDYKRLFTEYPEGIAVLDDLRKRFSLGASFDEHNAALITYHREGQRSVIDFILSRIKRANGAIENV